MTRDPDHEEEETNNLSNKVPEGQGLRG